MSNQTGTRNALRTVISIAGLACLCVGIIMIYQNIPLTIAGMSYSAGLALVIIGLIIIGTYLATTETRRSTLNILIVLLFALGLLLGYFFWAGSKAIYKPEMFKYDIFKDLTILMLTVAGVLVAAFGFLAYRILEHRLEVHLSKKLDEKYIKAIGTTLSDMGWMNWRNYKAEGEQEHHLENAIDLSEDALIDFALKLDQSDNENARLIYKIKQNLAFYYAELCRKKRCNEHQEKLALQYAKETYDRIGMFPSNIRNSIFDTYRFVNKHCALKP